MATELKSVIVVGGAGNLGVAVLPALLKTNLKVSVLTRPESKSTFPDGVNVVRSDYTASALAGQDAVVSLVGAAAYADQKALVDAALEAGVKWFVPSEFGGDTTNEEAIKLLPIFQAKKSIVDYLRTKESKLSWTGVITGGFFDWGIKVGFLGFNVADKTASVWDSGDGRFVVTNITTIGTAIANLLTDPSVREQSKNKHVYISSHVTSTNQILASFEKATGEKWKVTKLDGKEQVAEANKKFGAGDRSAIVPLLQATAFGDFGISDYSKNLGNDVLLKGVKEDLDEDVKRFAA